MKKKSLFTEYQHLCQHDYERKGTRSTLHAKQSLQQPVFARHEMSTVFVIPQVFMQEGRVSGIARSAAQKIAGV